ncbi:hypothetical protein MG293_014804 [Ovis ammon polii]|uniref:C2 domain-containing protein n=1 Tax=Ovis ammon polii TaxID=230172 RepID=A0AAD4TW27_OVIAM|nr:hypothetical protein MG293_014804 [Ovis ammon polii]
MPGPAASRRLSELASGGGSSPEGGVRAEPGILSGREGKPVELPVQESESVLFIRVLVLHLLKLSVVEMLTSPGPGVLHGLSSPSTDYELGVIGKERDCLSLHAAMDPDKPSVWGSLKQRTRPLLINLSKRKLKKTSSKTLELRAQHHLDRRLSLSVPDLLEAEALASEGRPYCGPQSSYTSVPSSLSTAGIVPKSSSSSLKQSEEELDWSQEEVGPFHMETDSEETFTSPAEDRRASSNGTLGLLQKTPSAEDASEGPELCGSGDLNAALTSQHFKEQSGFREAGDGLSNLPSPFAYLLTIHLKEGRNLVVRDRCGAEEEKALDGFSLAVPLGTQQWAVVRGDLCSRPVSDGSGRAGTSDPYVKFKLNGKTLYKSKVIYKNLNPVWDEIVVLPIQSLDQKLRVKVYDRDLTISDFMGSAFVILSDLELNRTTEHILKLEDPNSLEDDMGVIVLNLNLVVKQCDFKRHCLQNSLKDMKDVGILQVKVLKAVDLLAADFSEIFVDDLRHDFFTGYMSEVFQEGFGRQTDVCPSLSPYCGHSVLSLAKRKSDPFCLLELGNDRLQTHTIYKNLNPEWNKVFTFPIKDIHDVLEVTVFDEDGDKPPDFLGKVAIPLLSIRDGQTNCYVLKNKDLEQAFKGVIYLEMDLIYNPIKASIRTFTPREKRFVEDSRKLSKKVFLVAVWNFELYMIPLALLLLFVYNSIGPTRGKVGSIQDSQESPDVDEEDDEDDKESEKKGLIKRIYMVQDIVSTVQNILEELASFGERIKKILEGFPQYIQSHISYFLDLKSKQTIDRTEGARVPMKMICGDIPRVIGINKFTKKLRNPYAIDNNELLDFLSRVPSDVQKVQYAELKQGSSQSPVRKKRHAL